MKGGVLLTLIVAVAFIISATATTAQEPRIIHYQGILLGSDGNPVENGSYEINFTIWDDAVGGVQSLWSETRTVEVIDGQFNVNLGSTMPLLPQIFTPGVDGECQDDIVFLEVEVVGDEPMTPRIQMGKAPTSFSTRRIDGDIMSGPGKLVVVNEGCIGEHPYGELNSDEFHASISLADPRPTPLFPDLSIIGDESGARITTGGLIDTHPFFELHSDFSVAGLTLAYPYPMQPVPGLSFVADADGSEILFGITELQEDILSIGADESGGSMRFYGTGRDIIIEMSSSGDIIAQRGNFGVGNLLDGATAFVAGSGNSAEGDYSTVGGGQNNHALEDYSTVAGGQNNTADGLGSFVGGGYQNTASGGHSVVAGGNFNLNQGNYSAICGGYADTIGTSAYMSYLFGIGSHLTVDSTFMVDMPHIRFGDETNGYEFPSTDGAYGQVLVTDGHGQLSWDGHLRAVDDKLDRVIEENKELKNVITELERRIAELDRK